MTYGVRSPLFPNWAGLGWLAVSFFNFAWKDMTTPSVSLLTDIVRVAVSALRRGGKVTYHAVRPHWVVDE